MSKPQTKNAGFTLVELLIVIVIIAIIATLTIVAYNGIQQRAQASVVQADLSQTSNKLGVYYVDNNGYPSSLATVGINDGGGTSYQYTVDNTAIPATYCVTATNGSTAYMVSSTNNLPRSGVCPGHTAPGGGTLVANGGVVTTLAGSGSAAFADGTGTAAKFYLPQGITVDSAGNIYVADMYNNRIRKITPSGVVTTLAGSGAAGYADGTGTAAQFSQPSDVAVGQTGILYVSDMGNERIRVIKQPAYYV